MREIERDMRIIEIQILEEDRRARRGDVIDLEPPREVVRELDDDEGGRRIIREPERRRRRERPPADLQDAEERQAADEEQ